MTKQRWVDLVSFDSTSPALKKAFLITDRDGSISKAVSQARKNETIVGVKTSDRSRLLKALGDDAVDFVFPNILALKIDSSVATLAKKNNCAIALSLSLILSSGEFVKALRKTAEAIETLEHYNSPVIFATFAESELGARNEKDLENLLAWLGSENPRRWLETTAGIIERNEKRAGEMAPGVRVVKEGKPK